MPWWLRCFGKSYEPPEVMELDFRHSNLSEVPPDVFTYERTLEKLSLGSNQITTLPPSLFHCYELRELELYDNELQSIPAAIGSLTRLTRLNASRNGITEVADTIKNCKSLSHLDLSLNHLVKLPEGVSQLIGLEELNLSDTYLEYLNANFGRLTKLRILELRENVLQSLPKSMTRFTHLTRLDLGQNDFHEIPEVLGSMSNLTELFLDNNSIRAIPSFIGQLNKLGSLDCSNNDIYEIADEICKCSQLEDLSLNINNISGLPDGFGKLESLSVLRLDNNQIQYLPENFGHLKNLQEFSVMRNLLKALPPSIGLLRKLHTLLLDENLLSDLPKEIGSCVQLSVLHAAKNRLSTIPSEIGHLSNLKVLSLSQNSLVHLPVSILNIEKLGAIWLSESQTKPLLPFNKEIDSYSGQHVLTCFLLPQLPAVDLENELTNADSEASEFTHRSRQATIKFADVADEPTKGASGDDQAANTSRGPIGLYRAPTPYPKELRAMAKHASQLYSRHPKDQNGDVPNNEGAAYENNLHSEGGSNSRNEKPGPSEKAMEKQDDSATKRLLSNKNEYQTDYRSAHYDSIRRMRLGHGLPQSENTQVIGSKSLSTSFTTRTHQGTISDTSKTPPPYDLAARRAAFFRRPSNSSTSTSSTHDTSPTVPFPALPSKSFLQSPDLVSNFLHQETQEHDLLAQPAFPKHNCLNVTFTKEEPLSPTKDHSSLLNTTFTVVPAPRKELESAKISEGDNNRVKEEKRIIESIIRDGTALTVSSISQSFGEEEADGAADSPDGPPILPMKPITGNYTQFRSSASPGHSAPTFLSRNVPSNESFSKIPIFTPKHTDVVSKSPSAPKNSFAGISRQSAISNSPNKEPETTDHGCINSKIPVFLTPGQALTFSKVTPAEVENHDSIVCSQPNVQLPAKSMSTSRMKPKSSFNSNNVRVSVEKSKATQSNDTDAIHPSHETIPAAKLYKTPSSNSSQSNMLRRTSSGSKIPLITNPSPSSGVSESLENQRLGDTFSPESSVLASNSKIPSFGRKPWIFGSHRNTRVVPLEYKKVNQLGFTVCNSPYYGATRDNGVYVDSVDLPDSSVKLGDKLLQVDGIDMANMNLEIVRKILSNCQENINLLVSRDS